MTSLVIYFSFSQIACPPSCSNNKLADLYDKFCSDKGTFWQSRHHYASAYNSVFGSIRGAINNVLEIGIGEDTAPSVAAWLEYFPVAHIYAVDIKSKDEFAFRQHSGMTKRLSERQSRFGCLYDPNMWKNERVHLFLDTDASSNKVHALPIPRSLDIIVDDGSHRFTEQELTLHFLWDRLAPGGFYVIEDILVGALPWDASHASDVPSNNTNCGGECYFPQRLDEHPFLFDRFNSMKRSSVLREETKTILTQNDWFFTVTGVHKGGGLDVSLIIRKKGLSFRSPPSPLSTNVAIIYSLLFCVSFINVRACLLNRKAERMSYSQIR